LGAPTNHWVREAVLFNRETRALEDLQNFKVPIQMVVAQNDDIVDNQGSVEVCDRLKSCELVMASNAKHEILMEVDQIRDLSLQKIIQFFKRSPQRKIYDSRSDD
jgi:lysophospholipase